MVGSQRIHVIRYDVKRYEADYDFKKMVLNHMYVIGYNVKRNEADYDFKKMCILVSHRLGLLTPFCNGSNVSGLDMTVTHMLLPRIQPPFISYVIRYDMKAV